jgi:hypothetical protein
MTCVHDAPGLNLSWNTNYSEIFLGVPQSDQEKETGYCLELPFTAL